MTEHWERVVEECRELEEVDSTGKHSIDRKRMVDFAIQNPESALHEEFNWDKDAAAYEHWLWQAGQIITRVRVFFEAPKPEEEQVRFRYYTSVPDEVAGGHAHKDVRTVDILADPVERRRLIVRLLKSALGETKGYPQLEELDKWRKYTQRLIEEFDDTAE